MKTYFFSFMCLIFIFAPNLCFGQTDTCLKVLSPLDHEKVYTDVAVKLKGEVNKTPFDGYIWVLVRKAGTSDWWVQDNSKIPSDINKNDGMWEIEIYLGESGKHAGDYEIRVVSVSKMENDELLKLRGKTRSDLPVSLKYCNIVQLTITKELSYR